MASSVLLPQFGGWELLRVSYHRVCCCLNWTMVHKFDPDGVLMWSMRPAFITPWPQQVDCSILLMVGSRLIAHFAVGSTGWLAEIDTSTGEVGVWRETHVYLDLFTDGTVLFGTRRDGGVRFGALGNYLDKLNPTTFEQEASAFWEPYAYVSTNAYEIYHMISDGLIVSPTFAMSNSGGSSPILGHTLMNRVEVSGFPPATQTADYGGYPNFSGLYGFATSYLRPLGVGVWQSSSARYTWDEVDGLWRTVVADTWRASRQFLHGFLCSSAYIYSWHPGLGTLYRTPASGSGVQASESFLELGTNTVRVAPWSCAITSDGSRLAFCLSSDRTDKGPLLVVGADAEVIWSVYWPRQRGNASAIRTTNTLVMTDTGVVYAGTPPTDTRSLEVD
jgi:hypothetical protein